MKFLFVIAHGDVTGQSSAHRCAKAAKEGLVANGHEVRVVDLANSPFTQCAGPGDFVTVPPDAPFSYGKLQTRENLVAAIREQQELLLWCTHLIVFGPMWFYKLPSCFYAWTERVWTGGWAWDFGKKREELALYGRRALLVITTGAGSDYYSHGGALTSLDGIFYTTTIGINGCGFDTCRSQGIWDPLSLTPDQFKDQCEKLVKALLDIDQRPLLPFHDPNRPKGMDELAAFTELPNLELI